MRASINQYRSYCSCSTDNLFNLPIEEIICTTETGFPNCGNKVLYLPYY